LPSGVNWGGFRHHQNQFQPVTGALQAESATCSLLNNKEG